MAESIGVEPIHPLLSDGLAIRCLAARPTLRNMCGSGPWNRTRLHGLTVHRLHRVCLTGIFGGSKENRTPPSAVTGRCTNRYTMEPY